MFITIPFRRLSRSNSNSFPQGNGQSIESIVLAGVGVVYVSPSGNSISSTPLEACCSHCTCVSPLGACCSPCTCVSPTDGSCYSCCDWLLVYTFKLFSSFSFLHLSSSIGCHLVYTFKYSSSFGFLHLSSLTLHGIESTTTLIDSFSFVLNTLLSPSRLASRKTLWTSYPCSQMFSVQ
jgi:hypothetical protein